MKRVLTLAAVLTLTASAYSELLLTIPAGVVPAGAAIEAATYRLQFNIDLFDVVLISDMGDGSWQLLCDPGFYMWNLTAVSEINLTVCGLVQTVHPPTYNAPGRIRFDSNGTYVATTTLFSPFDCPVVDSPDQAVSFELGQAYPNPFNPATQIDYSLALTGAANLSVFNLAGERVATLADGLQERGQHQVTWHAAGQPSGVYLVRLQSESGVSTSRVTLIK